MNTDSRREKRREVSVDAPSSSAAARSFCCDIRASVTPYDAGVGSVAASVSGRGTPLLYRFVAASLLVFVLLLTEFTTTTTTTPTTTADTASATQQSTTTQIVTPSPIQQDSNKIASAAASATTEPAATLSATEKSSNSGSASSKSSSTVTPVNQNTQPIASKRAAEEAEEIHITLGKKNHLTISSAGTDTNHMDHHHKHHSRGNSSGGGGLAVVGIVTQRLLQRFHVTLGTQFFWPADFYETAVVRLSLRARLTLTVVAAAIAAPLVLVVITLYRAWFSALHPNNTSSNSNSSHNNIQEGGEETAVGVYEDKADQKVKNNGKRNNSFFFSSFSCRSNNPLSVITSFFTAAVASLVRQQHDDWESLQRHVLRQYPTRAALGALARSIGEQSGEYNRNTFARERSSRDSWNRNHHPNSCYGAEKNGNQSPMTTIAVVTSVQFHMANLSALLYMVPQRSTAANTTGTANTTNTTSTATGTFMTTTVSTVSTVNGGGGGVRSPPPPPPQDDAALPPPRFDVMMAALHEQQQEEDGDESSPQTSAVLPPCGAECIHLFRNEENDQKEQQPQQQQATTSTTTAATNNGSGDFNRDRYIYSNRDDGKKKTTNNSTPLLSPRQLNRVLLVGCLVFLCGEALLCLRLMVHDSLRPRHFTTSNKDDNHLHSHQKTPSGSIRSSEEWLQSLIQRLTTAASPSASSSSSLYSSLPTSTAAAGIAGDAQRQKKAPFALPFPTTTATTTTTAKSGTGIDTDSVEDPASNGVAQALPANDVDADDVYTQLFAALLAHRWERAVALLPTVLLITGRYVGNLLALVARALEIGLGLLWSTLGRTSSSSSSGGGAVQESVAVVLQAASLLLGPHVTAQLYIVWMEVVGRYWWCAFALPTLAGHGLWYAVLPTIKALQRLLFNSSSSSAVSVGGTGLAPMRTLLKLCLWCRCLILAVDALAMATTSATHPTLSDCSRHSPLFGFEPALLSVLLLSSAVALLGYTVILNLFVDPVLHRGSHHQHKTRRNSGAVPTNDLSTSGNRRFSDKNSQDNEAYNNDPSASSRGDGCELSSSAAAAAAMAEWVAQPPSIAALATCQLVVVQRPRDETVSEVRMCHLHSPSLPLRQQWVFGLTCTIPLLLLFTLLPCVLLATLALMGVHGIETVLLWLVTYLIALYIPAAVDACSIEVMALIAVGHAGLVVPSSSSSSSSHVSTHSEPASSSSSSSLSSSPHDYVLLVAQSVEIGVLVFSVLLCAAAVLSAVRVQCLWSLYHTHIDRQLQCQDAARRIQRRQKRLRRKNSTASSSRPLSPALRASSPRHQPAQRGTGGPLLSRSDSEDVAATNETETSTLASQSLQRRRLHHWIRALESPQVQFSHHMIQNEKSPSTIASAFVSSSGGGNTKGFPKTMATATTSVANSITNSIALQKQQKSIVSFIWLRILMPFEAGSAHVFCAGAGISVYGLLYFLCRCVFSVRISSSSSTTSDGQIVADPLPLLYHVLFSLSPPTANSVFVQAATTTTTTSPQQGQQKQDLMLPSVTLSAVRWLLIATCLSITAGICLHHRRRLACDRVDSQVLLLRQWHHFGASLLTTMMIVTTTANAQQTTEDGRTHARSRTPSAANLMSPPESRGASPTWGGQSTKNNNSSWNNISSNNLRQLEQDALALSASSASDGDPLSSSCGDDESTSSSSGASGGFYGSSDDVCASSESSNDTSDAAGSDDASSGSHSGSSLYRHGHTTQKKRNVHRRITTGSIGGSRRGTTNTLHTNMTLTRKRSAASLSIPSAQRRNTVAGAAPGGAGHTAVRQPAQRVVDGDETLAARRYCGERRAPQPSLQTPITREDGTLWLDAADQRLVERCALTIPSLFLVFICHPPLPQWTSFQSTTGTASTSSSKKHRDGTAARVDPFTAVGSKGGAAIEPSHGVISHPWSSCVVVTPALILRKTAAAFVNLFVFGTSIAAASFAWTLLAPVASSSSVTATSGVKSGYGTHGMGTAAAPSYLVGRGALLEVLAPALAACVAAVVCGYLSRFVPRLYLRALKALALQ